MRHGYYEGIGIYLAIVWGTSIFFAAADCELLCPLISFPPNYALKLQWL